MPDNAHLLIPLAASDAAGCQQVLEGLRLPHLERLLPRLQAAGSDVGSETDFSPPHERALARHLGLPAGPDGHTPWAAWRQQAAPGEACAYVTPCQWLIGADQVLMADPRQLQLHESDSRALLDVLAPWFEQDGIALHYQEPTRWLARGAPLAALPCASLDRVIGRDVRAWLPPIAQARTLHRLQSEVQMLLYTHPFNDERAQRGLPAINAFWVHGAGALDAATAVPANAALPDMPLTLRDAALREDWPAWAATWREIDAGPVARLAAQASDGASVQLTLCGECSALQWRSARRGLLGHISGLFGRQPLWNLREQL